MVNKEELRELFNWVMSPIIEVKNINELEKKLKEKYYILPDRVWIYGKTFDFSIDNLIIELFQRVECSNKIFFSILNKGRKYLNILIVLLSLFILSGLFSLGTLFELIPFLKNYSQMILLPGIAIIFILQKCSDKIFYHILVHMKPGDLLKILLSKDEIVMKDVKVPMIEEKSIFSNPSVSVAFSKKKLVCEDYREKIKSKTKNLYNLVVNFIATDFLINNEQNIESQNYLRKEAIDTLIYIFAFRNDSVFTLYYLAINELELLNIDESQKYFRKIYEIENNNIEINAWINVLDFIKNVNIISGGI
jgi:hypothetical protein